jgi:hypothetical protein
VASYSGAQPVSWPRSDFFAAFLHFLLKKFAVLKIGCTFALW